MARKTTTTARMVTLYHPVIEHGTVSVPAGDVPAWTRQGWKTKPVKPTTETVPATTEEATETNQEAGDETRDGTAETTTP